MEKQTLTEQPAKDQEQNMGVNDRSIGLGDTVEKITKAVGIKKVMESIQSKTGKDCGCKKRKDALNKAFPYGKNK